MSSVPPGSQHSRMFEKKITKTLSCNYLLFLPEDYAKKRQRWPLIVFLHGAGERGSDLKKVKVHGPPKIVENRKDFPFIVVSPQCPKDDWWTEKVEVLINLVDDIAARYKVDKERIYLTGLSMGGFGTWSLASAYPERFAAIAPICGEGSRIMALKLKDIPAWVFHGAKDRVVPLEKSEEMVNAIRNRGGDVKFTIYPDAGHDSWTESYDNQELYDWFLKHRKSKKK
ncbi:MAG: prolyl oligopeptidase family serine peptidase [Planctomycetes bacterium]|nr:prolyl oligopeptidase family serine peptidase [Planctomycetota bacterium]